MRDPADAAFGGRGEQGLRRRSGVRRAVVPENRKAPVSLTRSRVVKVQRTPVAQVKVRLFDHLTRLMGPWPGQRKFRPSRLGIDVPAVPGGAQRFALAGGLTAA